MKTEKIKNFIFKKGAFFLIVMFLTACGSTSEEESRDLTITIDDMSFSPVELSALPGDTIEVVNNDNVSHTVTSESSLNAFDNSGDFDTGEISPGDQISFHIPITATLGDIYFFYCDVHQSIMDTPNGQIQIE